MNMDIYYDIANRKKHNRGPLADTIYTLYLSDTNVNKLKHSINTDYTIFFRTCKELMDEGQNKKMSKT